MATEPVFDEEGAAELTWKERLAGTWETLRRLIETRKQLFQVELAQKTSLFARGAAGLAVAAAFGSVSVLLLTALIAALLTLLFGKLWAGLLATFLLYLIVAGIGATLGIRALSRVRLFQFPATTREIRKDWDAVRQAASRGERSSAPASSVPEPPAPALHDLEERFRERSE